MELLKLAPEAVLKPWGLEHAGVRAVSGVSVGVGELWLASAQSGPGNYSNEVIEPRLGRTLAQVLAEARGKGDAALERLIGPRPMETLRRTPRRGKTEAWHIREAAGRTGIAAGPRTPEQKARMREMLAAGRLGPDIENWPADVREAFGVIEPLRGGEVFLVPAGTLHTMFAAGPDSRLVMDEIQQGYGACPLPTLSKILLVQNSLLSVQVHPSDETVAAQVKGELKNDQDLAANPTVRISDFGRRPGERPDMGFRLTNVPSDMRIVKPSAVDLPGGGRLEVLVVCPQFCKSRFTLPASARTPLLPIHGSYRVLHCAAGSARLEADGGGCALERGQTVFVPAAVEQSVRIRAAEPCIVYDDALPDVDSVRALLAGCGRSPAEVSALLDPPRALS